MKLKFEGDGEVRIQEGLVVVLKKGETIDLPDETAKKLMNKNPEFKPVAPPVNKVKTIKMEDSK